MSRRLHAMLIVVALGPMVQSGSTQDRGQPELQCRTFGLAGRLQQNEVFTAPLSHGLEFRPNCRVACNARQAQHRYQPEPGARCRPAT